MNTLLGEPVKGPPPPVKTTQSPTRQSTRSNFYVGRFELRVLRGPDAGTRLISDGSEFSIGTAQGNTLRLTDATISRHHCALAVLPDGVRLTDLGSTNGTYLGGQSTTEARLADHALIEVGETLLSFEPIEEQVIEPLSVASEFEGVVGRSAAMRRIFEILDRVAKTTASILIEGETGTGKGLLAEAIHKRSDRSAGPFVVVDCTNLPSHLFETELFGHTAGSYTGATANRVGLAESAHGGTLFLDEIGELPIALQPKLLRLLENGKVRRIGSQESRQIDVRIIAATNAELRRGVNCGEFRSDLYYRLNAVRIAVPPLRDRKEDIAPITAKLYQEVIGDTSAYPPASLVRCLKDQPWPGNVRELRNAIERSVLMPSLAPAPRPEEPAETFRFAKTKAVMSWEREYLCALLAEHNGNLSRAARAASMDRTYLRKLVKQHGLGATRQAAAAGAERGD